MATQRLQRAYAYGSDSAFGISANDRGDFSSVISWETRIARTLAGVIAVMLGAWGGLVPYIGHALNFNADDTSLWTWNLQHGLLYLAPGIAAVAGGSALLMSAWVDNLRGLDLSQVTLPFGALVIGLSGIWFVLGPSISPIYYAGHVFAGATPARTFAEMLVYNLGVGVSLSMLAGVAGTWAVRVLLDRDHGRTI
jgi:hypothetical protein